MDEDMNAPVVDFLEPLIRVAAATLCALMAAQFARQQPRRFANLAGVLFCVGIGSYALICDPRLAQALGAACAPLILLAALTPAFFWWFAVSLFRDDPQWRPHYAIPLVLLLALFVLRQAAGEPLRTVGSLGHQVTVATLLLHVLSLAVRDFRQDLMDARRRFRLAVAIVLPATGLAIATVETYALFRPLPDWIGLLQAAVVFALAVPFALWLTAIRPDLMAQAAAPVPRPEALTPAEAIELARLRAAIAAGVCLEADLSLGTLADRLKVPEHRLRRLINKGLGYRNFAAFVNDHRVSQAKRILADPDNSRQQIVAVAFELGYASLAPFNRAFRQLTGMTPSEYRAQALARVGDSQKI
jgi:AraC-like DNA-binding protein